VKHALLFVPGFLFGIGLAVSGMVDPAKVLGFLDVAGGAWDPSLAFVMVGAIGVFAVMNVLIHRRRAPLVCGTLPGPRSRGSLDARLFVGAALFGAGWGLSGVCPGPALADLSTFQEEVLAYLGGLVVGILVAQRVFGADAPTTSTPAEEPEPALSA
jgi:uncharacterized membrane protein YedE/YeeE